MKIGDIDIATYRAKQQRVKIDHASINNGSEWPPGSAIPYFEKNQTGMKQISAELIVKGDGREDIMRNCSDILSLLLDACELTLDGYENKFHVILKDHSRTETSMRRWHILKLGFEGYEHGEEVSASGNSEVAVTNPGNVISPCIVEIIPRLSLSEITLTGICRDSYTGADLPVIIKDLETDKTITINGLTGIITQDGSLKEVDMWKLPSMPPGENVVTCDSGWMDITVITTPIYI